MRFMKSSAPRLLPLLRSRTQGDIFARLFLEPEHERSISELAEEVGASPSQVLREVNRLEEAGLVKTSRRGHSRLIKVHTDNPVYPPLSELLAVTFGAVPVLKSFLEEVEGIEEAFIFGSWAARYAERAGPVPDDIDVMVIGPADRDVLYDIGTEAGRTLHRDVNIRRMTREVWKQDENAPFRQTIEGRPTVPLIGRDGSE
jgi:DNA-binding Lrp family transcriptional regulator